MPRSSPPPRRAVTLVELMVAAAIVSAVTAVLLPAVQRVRGAAVRVRCQNNLRQLATAAHGFHAAADRLPWGADWIDKVKGHLEQGNAGTAQSLPVLACPADPRGRATYRNAGGGVAGLTWYVGLGSTTHTRSDGLIAYNPGPRVRLGQGVPDGVSQTVLCGERPPPPGLGYGKWTGSSSRDTLVGAGEPGPGRLFRYSNQFTGPPCPDPAAFGPGDVTDYCSFNSAWSCHPGGAYFAFGDGSVRFLASPEGTPTAGTLLAALVTRDGGESVPVP